MRSRLSLVAAVAAFALTLPIGPAPARTVQAIPLSTPRPAWFTADLVRQVHEAGRQGVALPAGVSVPASSLAFSGIRPGAWILFPAGCTTNFVFGAPGNYHIGTAGHCANVGDPVTIVALPGVLMEIGTTVKSVNNGIGDDFALIKIRADMQDLVNPSIAHVGGPTGVGNPQVGDIVLHSGHGVVIGTGGTPRAGIVTFRGPGENAGEIFGWNGLSTPGDSGSAVRLLGGAAAGDLTHLVVGTMYAPATIAGTTIHRMLQIAGLPLATAPAVPDPT